LKSTNGTCAAFQDKIRYTWLLPFLQSIKNKIPLASPDKAIIVEDKNGDQWVVRKDPTNGQTKVTKVEGGCLPPVSDIPVSEEEIDLLKKALAELKKDYSETKINSLQSNYAAKKVTLGEYKAKVEKEIVAGAASSVPASSGFRSAITTISFTSAPC
jgi:hypothetical protein